MTIHLHYSTLFMLTPTTNSSGKELGESVIFQPVLWAYPTHHSWIITAHVSLGHLEHHWKAFYRQLARTQQLLWFLDQQPSAPTQLLSMLQVELNNIEDIYNSYKTTIISAITLLQTNPSFNGLSKPPNCHRRSLLPFLGDALSWLNGITITKDINSIKTWINQLIMSQSSQQETLVHVIFILNITRYAAQVNRQSINILMDVVETTSHDINNLYNLTTSLAASISFHQLILYIWSVFANLRDSLSYIQMVSALTMDYIDAATLGTLSPHILPIKDLQKMLLHISDALPPTLHLPVSPDNIIHFRYLCMHILIENKQIYCWLMYPFRIGRDKSPSTKFSPWAFHMATFQLATMSIPST